MTPCKAALYALGAVALLGDASAEPFVKTQLPKAFPVNRVPENIWRLPQEVGDLMRRLSAHEAVRRLQTGPPPSTTFQTGPPPSTTFQTGPPPSTTAAQGPPQDGPVTNLVRYVDRAGNPTCDLKYGMPENQPLNVQMVIESETCIDSQEDGTSMTFGFDGRSVIMRTYEGHGCNGRPKSAMPFPCGCVMGIQVEGHLCAEIPPPAAYLTLDTEMPGMCAPGPSSSVARIPVWEGCRMASPIISQMTIEHVQTRNPSAMVYARVHMHGDAMVYSVHADDECASPPAELFTASCECGSPMVNSTLDFFESAWYLTGDFCADRPKAEARVFMFQRQEAPCSSEPVTKGSFYLGMCQPMMCTWDQQVGMPCANRTSMKAIADDEKRTVIFHEYHGSHCDGEPFQTGELSCGECVEMGEWEGHEALGVEFIKLTGPYCSGMMMSGRGGSCKNIPRSMVPSDVVEKLVPCMGEGRATELVL